jgi:hypothetical protein
MIGSTAEWEELATREHPEIKINWDLLPGLITSGGSRRCAV